MIPRSVKLAKARVCLPAVVQDWYVITIAMYVLGCTCTVGRNDMPPHSLRPTPTGKKFCSSHPHLELGAAVVVMRLCSSDDAVGAHVGARVRERWPAWSVVLVSQMRFVSPEKRTCALRTRLLQRYCRAGLCQGFSEIRGRVMDAVLIDTFKFQPVCRAHIVSPAVRSGSKVRASSPLMTLPRSKWIFPCLRGTAACVGCECLAPQS